MPSFYDLARAPRHQGTLEYADVASEFGTRGRSDWAVLSLCLDEDMIIAAGHQSGGNPAVCACLDALCSLLVGLELREASKLTAVDVHDFFDDFPAKMLPAALRAASLLDLSMEKLRQDGPALDSALICNCMRVDEQTIREHIRRFKLRSVIEVRDSCRAGGGCQSCWPDIERLIGEDLEQGESAPGIAEEQAVVRHLLPELRRLHPEARFVKIESGLNLVVELPAGARHEPHVRAALERDLQLRHGRKYAIEIQQASAESTK